jgi:1,2-diacylglycerol 3-alpha-glucosyltransferase
MKKSMENVKIAMVSKLMPYYRLGVFQKLTALNNGFEFTFFGDTKEQGGIKQIPFIYANTQNDENIRWIKTSNYFYKPERLLWQTGIIKEIFKSDFKFFVFEGAIAHYPIWLFAFLCKIRGKKVLFWTHGNRGLDRGIKKFLEKYYLNT